MTSVSIVRATDYETARLEQAVHEAVELAGGFDCRGATVLLKPNLLTASAPDRAVVTHPELVRAAVRWLKRAGADRVLVGDSPAWQPQDLAGLRSGVRDATESAGGVWADFSAGEATAELPEGKAVRRFKLAKVWEEADLLVSLPKLKTHGLMYFTGAVKNLFGLVPGIQKSAFHLRFTSRPDFAAMLADLALAARPDFALMDGIVAMEGPGPNSGRPKRLDLLLASKDALALDITASGLIGYDPAGIPYIADLLGREGSPFVSSQAEIETLGLSPAEARPASFDILPIVHEPDFFRRHMPAFAHRVVKDLLVARPKFDHRACVRCGGCVRICPAGALEIRGSGPGGRRVEIDYEKCIRCYCCHEICPEDAIDLVKGPRLGGGAKRG